MLAYFPETRKDETLYSALSRAYRYSGSPRREDFFEALFDINDNAGSANQARTLDNLSRLYNSQLISVDHVVKNMTKFSYFSVLSSSALSNNLFYSMTSNTLHLPHVFTGIPLHRKERTKNLRFCSECLLEMSARDGELYWCRRHQLPSVMVCSDHRCMLEESQIPIPRYFDYQLSPATRINCQPKFGSQIIIENRKIKNHLYALAKLSVRVLDGVEICEGLNKLRGIYMTKISNMPISKIERAFRSYWGRTLEVLSLIYGEPFTEDIWLRKTLFTPVDKVRPLGQLLIQHFLNEHDFISSSQNEMRLCSNPRAQHKSTVPTVRMKLSLNGDEAKGSFSCECGYSYERVADRCTGQVGRLVVTGFDPALESALRMMLVRGDSLNKIAGSLQLSIESIKRFSSKIGITRAENRATKAFHKDKLVRKNILDLMTDAIRKIVLRKEINQRDHPIAYLICQVVDEIYWEYPPRQVLESTIRERIFPHPLLQVGWVSGDLDKMISVFSESHEEFKQRNTSYSLAGSADSEKFEQES